VNDDEIVIGFSNPLYPVVFEPGSYIGASLL